MAIIQRTVDAALLALADAETVRPIFFLKLEFQDDPLYIHTWPGYVFSNFNPDTESPAPSWTGVPLVSNVGAIQEGTENDPADVTIGISGASLEAISLALVSNYRGRRIRAWWAALEADHTLACDPLLTFDGSMDVMTISRGETAAINLACTDRRARWAHVKPYRYTDDDQRFRYAGDKFFQYVPEMKEKIIKWGV